ncbi:MAG: polysaccharide biosynthesis tyrosine autokinase, partial [Kibdelosporangium sp.]
PGVGYLSHSKRGVVTFSRYLHIVKERWRLVLTGLLLGLSAAAVLTWTATPSYSADVVMFVASQDRDGDAAGAYQGNLMSQQKVKSYAQLLASDRVRQDIERRRGTSIEPDAISATTKPDTVLLTATVTDPSAQRAKDIADEVGLMFPALVAELERPADGSAPSVVVRVVEPASVPGTPVSPQPLSTMVIGSLLGLLAGLAAALARETLDNSVKSIETLAELVDAPALGTVTFRPDIADRPLVGHEPPGSPGAEAHRRIRTNLQFVDVDHPPKTVAVVSAVPGEAKTTTACNLAITLAESGATVALIDADLRRPRIADVLGLEGAVGLTSVLIAHTSLDHALQRWGPAGISILTSGPIPPNPSELLASQHMGDLLTELADRFDAVIVDTPPLLPVTDGAILAHWCDGALMVVRQGKTTKKQVRSAAAALSAVSARLLGVVLTMVPKTRSQGAYGEYNYGSGYLSRETAGLWAKTDPWTTVDVRSRRRRARGPAGDEPDRPARTDPARDGVGIRSDGGS